LAEYARNEEQSQNEVERAFHDGRVHWDRLYPLYFRVLGRLVLIAKKVEAAIPSAAQG